MFDRNEFEKEKKQNAKSQFNDNKNSVNYKFPPGYAHGYKCINGPMNIIYMNSSNYDLKDEIRIPHDDSKSNFDWVKINSQ